MIVCPRCAAVADRALVVQECVTEWTCPSCTRRFEVRIVFLERPHPVDLVAFRNLVNAALEEQGLTRSDLARLVGVTPAYISTLLSGRRGVSPTRAASILRILHAVTSAPVSRRLEGQ